MAYIDGMRLRLNADEMCEFHEMVMHPNQETLRRRDELFAELDQNPGVFNDDGSFEFEFTLEPVVVSTSEFSQSIDISSVESANCVEIIFSHDVDQTVTMKLETSSALLAA